MTADHYLREKCGPDSAAFYAVLFAPRAKRSVLRAVHVLWRELQEVAEALQEPAVTRSKLEWWHSEIERTVAGSARHPISQTLAPAVATGELAAKDLESAFESIAAAVAPPVPKTFDDLSTHFKATGAPFIRLVANLLNIDIPDRDPLPQLAVALELSRLITMLGADTSRRAQLVPSELSKRFALAATDWHGPETSPPLQALLEYLATEADAHYRRAAAALCDGHPSRAGPLLIHAAIERALLAQVAADRYPVLRGQTRLPPLRMLTIALRVRLLPAQMLV